MDINNVQQLFLFDLARTLGAEDTIAQGLQQMLGEVENRELRAALSAHEAQTRQQIGNLEQIFRTLGQEPQPIECESAEVLFKEFNDSAHAISSPEIKDLAAVMAAQKVEHLEIATYRGLMTVAGELDDPSIEGLLRENLQQEEQMAQRVEQFSHEMMLAQH